MLHSPAAPRLVVLDDNAYYASMRHEAYQVARAGRRPSGQKEMHEDHVRRLSKPPPCVCLLAGVAAGALYVQVHLPITVEAALARNAQRPAAAQQPPALIRRMAERLDVPDPAVRPWETGTVTAGAAEAQSGAALLEAVLAAAAADEPRLRVWQAAAKHRDELPALQVASAILRPNARSSGHN